MAADQVTPVEQLLARIRERHPSASIERLTVTHPADDDNLWFVKEQDADLQFECYPGGLPPFLIEGGDDERLEAQDVDEAVAEVSRLLGRHG